MGPRSTSEQVEELQKEYKDIVKQRYYIAVHCNTSYVDSGKITPLERRYLIEFINDEIQKGKEYQQKIMQQK